MNFGALKQKYFKRDECRMKFTAIDEIKVSQLALGCMNFYSPLSIEDSEYSMDYALEKGVTLFDTARVYGAWHNVPNAMGLCERVMGGYMKKRGNRHDIVVATKGCHPSFDNMTENRLTKRDIEFDLNESLKNLQTDYTDIWFLHRDHPDCDLFELMKVLHEQVKAGKIRVLGASNWSMKRIREANAIALENGFTPFKVSQIEWSMAYLEKSHLADQTTFVMDEKELEEYKKGDVALMLFSSQSRGFFQKAIAAGGFEALRKQEIASGRYDDPNALTRKYDYPCNIERIERVKELCALYKVDAAAIGLAFLTSQTEFAPIPILGYSNVEQLKESLAHPDLQLTPYQIKEILGGQVL